MKTILYLILIFSALPTSAAQLYKCEESGKTVYSDIQCSPTAKAFTTMPSSGGFNSAKKIDAADGPIDTSNPPAQCKFPAYTYGSEKGKALANDATAECLHNIALRKSGRSREVSTEAYNFWRDYHQMEIQKRANTRTTNCVSNGFGGMRCN